MGGLRAPQANFFLRGEIVGEEVVGMGGWEGN